VNNAAVVGVPQPALTDDGIEVTFGVNHLGHFYLTQLLLETLLKSKARVINVSSDAYLMLNKPEQFGVEHFTGDKPLMAQQDGKIGKGDDWRKYSESKLCNIYFTKELVKRNPELLSVSLMPGVISTGLFREWNDGCFGCCLPFMKCLMKSPESGCKTTIHCCKADISGVNGLYFKDEKFQELKPIACDEEVQLALWECSERLVKQLEK